MLEAVGKRLGGSEAVNNVASLAEVDLIQSVSEKGKETIVRFNIKIC